MADDAARRIARERFDCPVLLEAGAGTGKTRALVERLLAWTLDPGWRESEERLGERARAALRPAPGAEAVADDLLDGIVAITFTDAAAAEMAERLAQALGAIAAGRAPRDGIEVVDAVGREIAAVRAAILLDRLGRARIQTIHAFCRGLLAEHPFEAGLHPAFAVDADERELERIATETVTEQLTLRLQGEGDPELLALLTEGLEVESLLEAVLDSTRSGISPAALDADPFPPAAVATELLAAGGAVRDLVELLTVVGPRLNSGQRGYLEALRGLSGILSGDEDPVFRLESAVAAIEEMHAASSDYAKKWSRGESIAAIEKHRGDAGEPLPVIAARTRAAIAGLESVSPAGLAPRRRLVAPLLRSVRERLRREGFVLFGELLDRAADLVERRPEIRDSLRRSIRQLLVDEFQDTDDRQCRLIERIALDPRGAARPSLFLVGDPKQSIYGWRGADLAAYERFLASALDAGGIRARLEVNFRSVPAVLAEVERVVGAEMVAEPGLQPAFEPLRPSPSGTERGTRRSDRPAIEFWSSTGPAGSATRSGEANRLEAAAVARDIVEQRALEPGLAWRDFGILARSTTELEVVLQALREAGVPFAVERDRSYWRRREVIDLAAAVRAILEPGDHLALLSFLRSPFVGVPDAAWIPLWQGGLPARIDGLSGPDSEGLGAIATLFVETARRIAGSVPGLERIAGWETSAILAVEALAELRAAFGQDAAEDWIERLRSRLAPEATAAGRFLGRFGVANLARFLRELTETLEASGDDPAAMLRSLRQAVSERREAEEAQPPGTDGNAVRVMTIHKSKGLEFRQVYLVQLHRGKGSSPERAFIGQPVPEGSTPIYQLLGCRTFGRAAAAARAEQIGARERVRLLYVAMTRARDRLVMTGQLFSERATESFLPMLTRRRLGTPAETGPPATPALDSFGALWRTPALEPAATSPGAPVPSLAHQGLDNAALRVELEQLTERRSAALARALRPRVGRASDSSLAAGDGDFSGGDFSERPGREVELARRRGLILHRALELAPLANRDPAAWRRASMIAGFGTIDDDQRTALDGELDALLGSALWGRLRALESRVVARELPLLVARQVTDQIEDPEPGAGSALDGHVGTLDLLYLDPEGDQLVIADFKSDALADESEVEGRIAAYRSQLGLYGRAVRDALGLVETPRLELWLLGLDRIVVVAELAPPQRR